MRGLWRRLGVLFRRSRFDRELEEEIESHLEMQAEEHREAGMEAAEARYAARRQFGNVTLLAEQSREAWCWRWLEGLGQDLRYGVRLLRRSPGVTAVTVATLALGIGAATAVFSTVSAYLFRPLPFGKPEGLVHIWQTDARRGSSELRVSAPDLLDWTRQATSFEALGAYYYSEASAATGGEPFPIDIARVTPALLTLLGVQPLYGRFFTPAEGVPGREQVAIVSHSFWERRLGADPGALGRAITINGQPHTLAGVMPRGFVFPLRRIQVWLPLALDEGERRDAGGLLVVGRLRAGVSRAQAQAEMSAITGRLALNHPETNRGRGARVVPLREALVFFYGQFRAVLFALLAAVLFLLLIVCANLGNLQLARAIGRAPEAALRMALGASRARVVRQLLAEGLPLALAGSASGALLAAFAVGVLERGLPEDIYRVGELRVDTAALAFSLALSLASWLLFGLAPALEAGRSQPSESVNAAPRGATATPRARRWRTLLVVSQISVATLLLAGTFLSIHLFLTLQRTDPGFDPRSVLTLKLALPAGDYPEPSRVKDFFRDLQARLESLPGVESVGAIHRLPLNFEADELEFVVPGGAGAPEEKQSARELRVTSGYFRAMRIALIAGRDFNAADSAGAPRVVVVNQRLAATLWSGASGVGRQVEILRGERGERATIVGVVADSQDFLLMERPHFQMFLPLEQHPARSRFVVLRSRVHPLSLAGAVRREVAALDAALPVRDVRAMTGVRDETLTPAAAVSGVVGLLGAGALILAALGVFGVVSLSVRQREREFGIRLALGAASRDILGLVLRQAMNWLATGVVLGLALTGGLVLGLRAWLGDGYAPLLGAVAGPLLMAGVALAACLLPARRATRIEPMEALRCE